MESIMFKKGDRVTKSPMWKYDKAVGTIVKVIKKDRSYFVKWDDINGEWYFTPEQSKELELIDEKSEGN